MFNRTYARRTYVDYFVVSVCSSDVAMAAKVVGAIYATMTEGNLYMALYNAQTIMLQLRTLLFQFAITM